MYMWNLKTQDIYIDIPFEGLHELPPQKIREDNSRNKKNSNNEDCRLMLVLEKEEYCKDRLLMLIGNPR